MLEFFYSNFFRLGAKYAAFHAPGKFKLKEKSISEIRREVEDPSYVMQPKIDGVGVAVYFKKGEPPRVFTAEPKKTGLREHTEKIPALQGIRSPGALDETIIRGELFAIDKATGRAVPAHRIIGLVNAQPEVSRKRQEELGVELRIAPFSIYTWNGHEFYQRPYKDHLPYINLLTRRYRNIFVDIPKVSRPEDKLKLLDSIERGRFPLTREGVVFHHLEKAKEPAFYSTVKAKFRPDFDVYVRRIFPTKDNDRAGGFEFSWTPRGPIVGRVGTGFSHTLAKEMLRNPQKFIGRVAKVRSVGPFGADGALRAPSFSEWHLEKGKQDEY